MSEIIQLNLAIIEDDPIFSNLLIGMLKLNNAIKIEKWPDAKSFLNNSKTEVDIVIADYHLPDMDGLSLLGKIRNINPTVKSIIVSGQQKLEVVISAYNAGADEYIIKDENCLPKIVNSIKNLSENVLLHKEINTLKSRIDGHNQPIIIGKSEAISNINKLIAKAAAIDILTLITGESGTGKELAARSLHFHSKRNKNRLVTVNMASIPTDLIESELFGHEKGAFTGAVVQRIGKFEEANNGTIFLDEIGDMPINLQARLLRVLEDSTIVKVGSNKPLKLDIRILAATNKDLSDEVKKGNFREDLYYRLQGFLIHMPTLRERKEDIELLANYFLGSFCRKNQLEEMSIDKAAINLIKGHFWPGNVRELKSAIERAALMCDKKIITVDCLNIRSLNKSTLTSTEELTMEQYKDKIIKSYMEKYNDDINIVSKKLDISRATIYRYLKSKHPVS